LKARHACFKVVFYEGALYHPVILFLPTCGIENLQQEKIKPVPMTPLKSRRFSFENISYFGYAHYSFIQLSYQITGRSHRTELFTSLIRDQNLSS
jgi:hypothetical protein